MNLIDQVGRLKELDAEATIAPWETEESDEGHEIRMGEAIESRGQYQSHHIIEYNHGCESSDDSSVAEEEQYLEAQANAYLISELRNVAPTMLEVLGGFQVGDAHALTEITALLEEVANISPGDRDLLHRMRAMAAKMEEQ